MLTRGENRLVLGILGTLLTAAVGFGIVWAECNITDGMYNLGALNSISSSEI